MTARLNDSTPSVSHRRGPRYRLSGESPQQDTASLRFLRAHTAGLSNRIRVPSIEGMRAGTIKNPFGLMDKYATEGRAAGLPKSWGTEIVVWVQARVDALWPMESTPLVVLEEKAMRAEAVDDLCEKRYDLERDAISLRERISSLTNEIVADQLTLARLEREMETK